MRCSGLRRDMSYYNTLCDITVVDHAMARPTVQKKEAPGCILSIAATDVLVLKHQTISIHSAH